MQLLWPIVAIVLTPIAYFLGHLIYVLAGGYLKHKFNVAKYSKIPKHHDGNIFLSLLDPKRDTAEVYKVFTLPGKGNDMYDLVHIGPGAFYSPASSSKCRLGVAVEALHSTLSL
jgi:hypothetical protein